MKTGIDVTSTSQSVTINVRFGLLKRLVIAWGVIRHGAFTCLAPTRHVKPPA